jgi:hypothetical protein
VGITECVWLVQEYTATSDSVGCCTVVSIISLFRRFLRVLLCWRLGAWTSSCVFPAGCVTGLGRIECAYQNQIPPVLPMLSCDEAFDRSFSFATSVLSKLWSDLSMRFAEGETEASKSRLAARTNRKTSTRVVIVVICLMVQVSLGMPAGCTQYHGNNCAG